MAHPYVSQADLKRELPYDHNDLRLSTTDFDALLDDVLAREADRVEGPAYADTAWETRTATETLDGTGSRDLPLKNRPVQSVTSLTVREGEDPTETVTVDPSEVWVYDAYLRLKTDDEGGQDDITEFPDEPQGVTVEYEWGYTEAPGLVEDAITRLVRAALDMVETDTITSEGVAGHSLTPKPPRRIRRMVAREVRRFRPPRYKRGAEVLGS